MKINRTLMAKAGLVLILSFVSFSALLAQSIRLKGTVIDSTTTPMAAATVVLLQPLDSSLISYAITDNQGGFTMNKIEPGSYHLQITYVGYGNYMQKITVDPTSHVQDLGVIFLSPKNILLEQVLVKAEHVPVVIKNDTIEYNAAAFKTKPNAAVEELLKRLPGVDVQRDGSIKAQGEDVENVLVDGKEFFGKDTKIATQNLPADIVDKVQVFDKKSEMAEFSGIDDGNEEKTINLSLKEGKKKGYFGNVEGGLGVDDVINAFESERYNGKLSVNRFDSKLQLSVLGMANNINDPGFSFNDYINFMGGLGSFMSGGNMSMTLNTGDLGIPLGYDSSPGITNTAAGGLNFNFDFNDKTEWQSSYFINRIDNTTLQNIQSQNLGSQSSFTRLEESNQRNVNLNHRFNTSLRVKLDTTTQMTWINRLSFNTRDLNSSRFSQTLVSPNQIENESDNKYENSGDQFNWISDLTVRKKLNKPGRILSGNIALELGQDRVNSVVDNLTTIFNDTDPMSLEHIFQDQTAEQDLLGYAFSLNYNEPIKKNLFLGFNASRSNDRAEQVNDYFDIDPDNPSSRIRNILLSNQYRRDYTYSQIGSSIRFNKKKMKLSGGLNLQQTELVGDVISENFLFDKRFNQLLPNFRLDYEFGEAKSIEFRYRTRIQEPTVEQLQPALNNVNPLVLFQGNPDLKPEYIHSNDINLTLIDQFSFTSFFTNLRTRYTLNRIVNQSSLDEQFRQIITPINTDFDLNTNLYSSFSAPLKFIKSKISLDVNVNYNRGILFVNELKNNTDRWINNYTFTLENRKKEVVDIAMGLSLGTSQVKYSQSLEFNQNYFDQTYFNDLILYLPKNWTFESKIDYTIYSDESFGARDELFLWQIMLSKTFLKNERGTLELRVFDVLNQNQGIDRTNNLNYIQESRTNVLGRYVMLSFNYKLSQFGGKGQMEVEMRRR